MVFSSTIFIFFFLPVTLTGYFLIPDKGKNIWLLIMSLFFYFWGGPAFFPVIICSILLNYVSGLLLGYLEKGGYYKIRKLIFIAGILCNLLLLGYWKYATFLLGSLKALTGMQFAVPEIALPIGISFFTFQGMSYIIDVYRGEARTQKSLWRLGLYISLFPQLIAGPIVRYTDIEKQLFYRTHSVEKFASGVRLFAVGLAKKAILANSVAVMADEIFALPAWQNTPSTAWLGLISYTFQLYFDFSGYSDMAVGIGKMFGFQFPRNFNYPFLSRSISEVWRRWHISLSSWFRDYVYFPLGGSRTKQVYRNLFLVFLLSGIWHGASWNYIVWGIYNGVIVVLERLCKTRFKGKLHLPGFMHWIITMFLWMMGMVIFRTGTLSESLLFYRSLFGFLPLHEVGFGLFYYLHLYEIFILAVCLIAMLPLGKQLFDYLGKRIPSAAAVCAADIIALAMIGISVLYIVTGTYNPFIYFQF